MSCYNEDMKVIVFNPTGKDKKTKVRGVGRYVEVLREVFANLFVFSEKIVKESKAEVFINPFFNFIKRPVIIKRLFPKQIGVVYDLIPLDHPPAFPLGIKGRLNLFLNKMALRNYDMIITDTETTRKRLTQVLNLDPTKIKVVYPTLPKSFWQKKKTDSINIKNLPPRFCLYVGDATWNKNLVNLAKAIKIINVSCVFVGRIFSRSEFNHPELETLRLFFQEVKGDKRFIFAGFLPQDELLSLYEKARVNLLVSRDEGFGFSFLEAATQSTPSVLSTIAVFRETAEDAAFFVDPDDPYDIANGIGEVFFNDKLRIKLAKKAKERSLFFSQKRFKEEFLTVLNL